MSTYSDEELRRRISECVLTAFQENPTNLSQIIELLYVQLKPLVKDQTREYTIGQLRELLS
jgi:hypothetical protein